MMATKEMKIEELNTLEHPLDSSRSKPDPSLKDTDRSLSMFRTNLINRDKKRKLRPMRPADSLEDVIQNEFKRQQNIDDGAFAKELAFKQTFVDD